MSKRYVNDDHGLVLEEMLKPMLILKKYKSHINQDSN